MSKMSREFKFQMKVRQVPRKYRTLREWIKGETNE